MATTKNVKFFKGGYGATDAKTKSTQNEGGIVFDTTSKQIYVAGTAFGGNITDVTFNDSKLLTITKADNSTITLNFGDTASATATMNVFTHIDEIVGNNFKSADKDSKLDYSGTTYLSEVKDGETVTRTAAASLVEADKRLDAAIKAINDAIAGMDYNTDGAANLATVNGNVITLATTIKQEDGTIAVSGTQALAAVAKTGESTNVAKSTDSTATYDTTAGEISDTWKTVVTGNALADGDTVDADLNKLDNKIAGLADELIADEKVINGTFSTIKSSLGAKDDMTMDFSDLSGDEAKTKTNVHDAIKAVEAEVTAASITIDGHKGAITTGNGLNAVAADGGSFSVKAKANDYVKVDADGVQIDSTKVDSNYTTANTTNLATVNTVKTAVEGLDVNEEVQAVTYTAATDTTGAKLVFNGIEEEDGKIKAGDGATELQFAKVATTGAASEVSVTYDGGTDNNTVQKAITNIDSRLDSLEALPTYDVVVSKDAATTPAGVKWNDGTSEITGTLAASADTMHKIYLVKTGTGEDSYAEYISVKTGESTYVWEKVGNTAADLKGYVKTISVNGKDYTVGEGTTKVTLGDVITTITGEEDTELNNTDYINVKATTADAADGSKVTTLSSSVKTTAIADAKAAEGEAAAVDGLATALDVKNSLKSTVEDLDAEITSTDGTNVTVKVTEVDGKITAVNVTDSYATITRTAKAEGTEPNYVVTTGDENKLVKASNLSDLKSYTDDKIASTVEGLDADKTSDDTAVATVEVKEEDGKITDVIVTNISAGVTGTRSADATYYTTVEEYNTAKGTSLTADEFAALTQEQKKKTDAVEANITAATATGAVTGADIATIKNYVDDKSAEASKTSVEDKGATITVNDTNATTIATVAGTDITAKAQLVWEEWN